MVPEPYLSLTLPSIHDDKELECRIYNPSPLGILPPVVKESQPLGAVFAHPYAPLGGCFDDPVVLSVVQELLKQGFIVGTFNFRGAGLSKGTTSWTGKAEVSDYISFTVFLLHLITGIHRLSSYEFTNSNGDFSHNQPEHDLQRPGQDCAKLILGGYSYGSMITTQLPSIGKVLERFSAPERGSTEAEIILRAKSLAIKWSKDVQLHREAAQGRSKIDRLGSSTPAMTFAMAVGGDESEPGSRRPSRDSRRSIDLVRRSMERSRRRFGMRQRSSDDSDQSGNVTDSGQKITVPNIYYLLVSPLLPPISTLATMFSNLRASDSDDELAKKMTLVVWGSKETFTSSKKLRKWADFQQSKADRECFQAREVVDAGHFWREPGVQEVMKNHIVQWLARVINDDFPKS